MTMDVCTLWWVDQWVVERKSRLPKEDMGLESYKRWVWDPGCDHTPTTTTPPTHHPHTTGTMWRV